MPTNLPLRNRSDPAQRKINGNSHNPNNPKHLLVILVIVSENDGEDDTTQIANGPRASRDDTVSIRVHVRHEREIGTVARFEEEGHAGNETKHRTLVVRIRKTNRNLEHARHNGESVYQEFLTPYAGLGVDGVRDQPASRPERDIEKPKHGRPTPRARLSEVLEIFEIVSAEYGIDGKLGAEGAEVASSLDERLEGEDDGHRFFKSGLADNFTARDIEHLLFSDLGFTVFEAPGAFGVEFHF